MFYVLLKGVIGGLRISLFEEFFKTSNSILVEILKEWYLWHAFLYFVSIAILARKKNN